MSYIPVVSTKLLYVDNLQSKDGRGFHIIEIENPEFKSSPGQFVMIQKETDSFQWSYPYMVLEHTANGFKIVATEHSSLYDCSPGDSIALWGANGKACELIGNEIFISEPATFHLILPLLRSVSDPELILYGDPDNVPEKLLPKNTIFIKDINEVIQHLEQIDSNLYTALNISNLENIASSKKESVLDRLTVFVSTRIGCGIGACRSCYLHSPDIKLGIPVCCHGPYLPYRSIDFSKDKNCFQTFI